LDTFRIRRRNFFLVAGPGPGEKGLEAAAQRAPASAGFPRAGRNPVSRLLRNRLSRAGQQLANRHMIDACRLGIERGIGVPARVEPFQKSQPVAGTVDLNDSQLVVDLSHVIRELAGGFYCRKHRNKPIPSPVLSLGPQAEGVPHHLVNVIYFRHPHQKIHWKRDGDCRFLQKLLAHVDPSEHPLADHRTWHHTTAQLPSVRPPDHELWIAHEFVSGRRIKDGRWKKAR
jgi:hypothetical protein